MVESEDGEEHEVFLKPSASNGMDVDGLASEVLAACVAGSLGLPVCQPYLVEISPEWIASIPDADVRAVLSASLPLAFGSTVAGDGWRAWTSEDTLTTTRREAALPILVFDALIENPDRRPGNPNLLLKNEAFRIIDHEMSLRIRLIIPSPTPWQPGSMARLLDPLHGHIFAPRLKGTRDLDFRPIGQAWTNLSDANLADFEATLPMVWAASVPHVTAALTHLRGVRDRINDCLVEIERVLS